MLSCLASVIYHFGEVPGKFLFFFFQNLGKFFGCVIVDFNRASVALQNAVKNFPVLSFYFIWIFSLNKLFLPI